jgi:Na+/alanine symporter
MNWFLSTICDKDGKPSCRRLTGLCFVILTTLVVLSGIHNIYVCKDLPTNYLYFLLIMVIVVMLYGFVITFEKIIEILKVIRNVKDPQ